MDIGTVSADCEKFGQRRRAFLSLPFPFFKSNWIEVWTVSMSGNLPRGVAGLLRWPRNRLVHPFSGKKNKQNKRPEMERETLRIRERKTKRYSGQPTVLLSFFSWVEGVVYVDAPVSLAHLSNLEHVRVSVRKVLSLHRMKSNVVPNANSWQAPLSACIKY